MSNPPFKILFKYPCRGRRTLFFESLDSLDNAIRDRNNYHIALTLDENDPILNTQEVVEKIINTYPNVSIQWGLSESKIHAINRDFPDYDYDILVCWSNDMFATFYGFDDVFREYFHYVNNQRGDFDFLLHFPEVDAGEHLNVLYTATKPYFQRFNYIYHPSYKSLWCDNESMDVAKILRRYYFIGYPGLFIHKNAAYHQYNLERDDLFNEQQSYWNIDEENYYLRKSKNFDL